MHNTKLIRSLRQLSGRQLSRFGDFIASPYFNRQSTNIAFFEWLRKYAPAFSHRDLEVDRLLDNWPLSEPIDQRNFRYLVSRLHALLEQFLVVEQLTADPSFDYYRLLQPQAAELGIEHLLQRAEQKLQQLLDAAGFQDHSHYLRLYQLHLDQYERTDPYDRQFNPKLQIASDSLDIYYLISRLRFAWQMYHLEAVAPERYTHYFEEELLHWIDRHPAREVPAVILYRRGLQMLASPERVEHYFSFKAGLQELGHHLPPSERKLLYTGLLNYCIKRGNQEGDRAFLAEYLTVNELLMAEGLLLEADMISPWRYVNLKMAALRVDRDDWAWNFIHEYRDHLPAAYRDNVFCYAQAYVHFHRGDYGQAQALLARVQFEDLLFNVALRTLLARVHYEAGEIETLLIPQLEANRLYILRHKDEMSARLYEQWRNFNRRCAQLARLSPYDGDERAALRTEIAQEEQLLHQDWLLEKLEASP